MSQLQVYLEMRNKFRKQIEEGSFPSKHILILQELDYRIGILETFQNFYKTAPISTDMRVIGYHHRLVLSFIAKISVERKLGEKADKETEKRRETAQNTLAQVVEDCSRRFSSFKAESDGQYKETLKKYLNTILPVWFQFRTSYVAIQHDAKEDASPAIKPVARIPETSDASDEETTFKRALSVKCPIRKYSGKTLGDLLSLDPKALKWIATNYEEDHSIKEAAKFICEYALKQCA